MQFHENSCKVIYGVYEQFNVLMKNHKHMIKGMNTDQITERVAKIAEFPYILEADYKSFDSS